MKPQRCLCCGHPVDNRSADVGLIRMNNQPHYFHKSWQGCQAAEAELDKGLVSERLMDEEIHMRYKAEKISR